MGKLVRDKIPEMIEARGDQPVLEILDKGWLKRCLTMKLIEEASELVQAENTFDVMEELADCLEVLKEICIQHGMSWDRVEQRRVCKRQENGGWEVFDSNHQSRVG